MSENIKEIILKMRTGLIFGQELEEMEEYLLAILRITDDRSLLLDMLAALEMSGTILAVPTLFGIAGYINDQTVSGQIKETIQAIRSRAKRRESILPEEYYTVTHWKPVWHSSHANFLSYVTNLVAGNPRLKEAGIGLDLEIRRVGNLLIEETNIDISPYRTFEELRVCTTEWDEKEGTERLLDRLQQESVMESIREQGVDESILTFFEGQISDLRYDYLITRLQLSQDYDYYRFAFEMAECYNSPDAL